MKRATFIILLIYCNVLLSQSPVVENVRFEQRKDGSHLVDIYYDVTDMHGGLLDIIVEASDDSGTTWTLPCKSLTGDVGVDISSGTAKHVVWDFYADNPDTSGYGYCVRVTAHENLCGVTITKDLTLTRDFHCPSGTGAPAINIGASNITLDLNGHTISGSMLDGYIEGIIAEDVDGITIKNGTFLGFGIAVLPIRSDNTIIENLTIKNLDIEDPDIPCGGIVAGSCQNLLIRDCYFEYLDTHHKEGVIISNSNAIVENIEQHYGSVGVNYGGSIEFEPTKATVRNCKFFDSKISGILVQLTDSAHIINNAFSNSAIFVDPAQKPFVSGLVIEDNDIKDCIETSGVNLVGANGVLIVNNRVSNCDVGISLTPSRGCAGDSVGGEKCFYASGNIIRDNIVLGNNIDLYHCDECLGNTWEGNTYETAHGIEVYTVSPATAKEYLASADSAAQTVSPDAQLLLAASWTCDTTGTTYEWTYIYESSSQMEKYEFRLINGKIIRQDSVRVGWMIPGDALPITDTWIDSDSAIVIAENQGGTEFRKIFDINTIEMSIMQTHSLEWTVHYVSQDSIFTTYFDATME